MNKKAKVQNVIKVKSPSIPKSAITKANTTYGNNKVNGKNPNGSTISGINPLGSVTGKTHTPSFAATNSSTPPPDTTK